MGDGTLETERLILRPPVAEDLPWVLEAMNTEPVLRHLGGVRSAKAAAENFAGDIKAFAEGTHMRWTVSLRDSAVRVGRVGLFTVYAPLAPAAMKGQREIGWTFAAAHWGRGYATEAARAVLNHSFGPLGLPRVYSQTSESNLGSTRMMQRLGFTRRAELDYVDPDYPPADNPTTVWSRDAPV